MDLGELPREQWTHIQADPMPFRVWIGEGYLVQAYHEQEGIVRLTVNSVKREGRKWADRIPWDDLHAIKVACGYGKQDAVEVYPPTRDTVNVANMRHLWVLPYQLPFAWRRDG